MIEITALPLEDQRLALRQRMSVQRECLARHLTESLPENKRYPRSMTMRFLTQESGIQLMGKLATILLGARLLKTATTALAFSKVVRNVVNNTQR